MVRFHIACYLEDSGFTVLEESDGAMGLALARNAAPDLVLCDLRMPGMDGLEILRILHSENPLLPVIVVSGVGVLVEAVKALQDGAWDFVTKPIVNMAILEHSINTVLERAQLIRKNATYQRELEEANHKLRSNLERFEQDAVAGRKTQLQLMPPPENVIENYQFKRHLLPCLYLTGDFVDYFIIKPGYIGFLLADASGHGAASAFITVLLKSFIERYRQSFMNDGNGCLLQPSLTLTLLNQDLRKQKLDKYMTIFYGVIDTTANCLVYSSGGHFPYPILFDGQIGRFLDTKGSPVGLFSQPIFADTQVELPKVHTLTIFSDGVLDALPETRLGDKKKRLLKAIEQCGSSPTELCTALGLHSNLHYPDDITFLVAERKA